MVEVRTTSAPRTVSPFLTRSPCAEMSAKSNAVPFTCVDPAVLFCAARMPTMAEPWALRTTVCPTRLPVTFTSLSAWDPRAVNESRPCVVTLAYASTRSAMPMTLAGGSDGPIGPVMRRRSAASTVSVNAPPSILPNTTSSTNETRARSEPILTLALLRSMSWSARISPLSSVVATAWIVRPSMTVTVPIEPYRNTRLSGPVVTSVNDSVPESVPFTCPVMVSGASVPVVVTVTSSVRSTLSLMSTGPAEVTSSASVVVPLSPVTSSPSSPRSTASPKTVSAALTVRPRGGIACPILPMNVALPASALTVRDSSAGASHRSSSVWVKVTPPFSLVTSASVYNRTAFANTTSP